MKLKSYVIQDDGTVINSKGEVLFANVFDFSSYIFDANFKEIDLKQGSTTFLFDDEGNFIEDSMVFIEAEV